MNYDLPLYVVGMPDDEFNTELIMSKLSSSMRRLKLVFGKIDEARLSIKILKVGGKRKKFSVKVLIKTPKKRFNYKEHGWDLSNVCEKLNQIILSNLSKRNKLRGRKSIRKIGSPMKLIY